GTPCRFRTAYDVQLAPIELLSAALESPAPKNSQGKYAECQIRLSMRCFGDADLHEIKVTDTDKPMEYMRFYLDGDPQLVFPLYEIIFNHAVSVEFRAKETPLNNKTIKTIANLQ